MSLSTYNCACNKVMVTLLEYIFQQHVLQFIKLLYVCVCVCGQPLLSPLPPSTTGPDCKLYLPPSLQHNNIQQTDKLNLMQRVTIV